MILKRMEFLVKGKGDRYTVAFEIRGTNANAFCTCQAVAKGQYCKHRIISIMDGDVRNSLFG